MATCTTTYCLRLLSMTDDIAVSKTSKLMRVDFTTFSNPFTVLTEEDVSALLIHFLFPNTFEYITVKKF